MPRLFTGLELPETVAGAVALARGGVYGARWMDPADYHIPLRFVGDVDAGVARDIAETLEASSAMRRSSALISATACSRPSPRSAARRRLRANWSDSSAYW